MESSKSRYFLWSYLPPIHSFIHRWYPYLPACRDGFRTPSSTSTALPRLLSFTSFGVGFSFSTSAVLDESCESLLLNLPSPCAKRPPSQEKVVNIRCLSTAATHRNAVTAAKGKPVTQKSHWPCLISRISDVLIPSTLATVVSGRNIVETIAKMTEAVSRVSVFIVTIRSFCVTSVLDFQFLGRLRLLTSIFKSSNSFMRAVHCLYLAFAVRRAR